MSQTNQTRQILAHLSGQVGSLPGQKQPARNQTRGPSVLVLFAGNPIGLEETVQHLKKLKAEGWSFDFAFSSNAEALMNADWMIRQFQPAQVIGRNMKDLSHYSMDHLSSVMAPQITHNTARKLVMGVQDGLIPNLLWQALWDGIPVLMDMDSLLSYHGRKTNNAKMLKIMESTIQELKAMGVQQLSTTVPPLSNNRDGGMTTGRLETSVITEKDILAMGNQEKVLNVAAGAIMTPLAKDTAMARGIQIIRH